MLERNEGMKMDLREIYPTNKLERELFRETLFKRIIMNTDNIRYLKGIARGMKRRGDIPKTEKRYYLKLIKDKINVLAFYPNGGG